MRFLDLFRKHLKIEIPSSDYYELETEFNTKWVSLDYGGSTAARIRRMSAGEPVYLEWSDTPFRTGEHIRVLTQHRKQIGWAPVYACLESGEPHFVSTKILEAVKNGWPVSAQVKRTGHVDDPEKNIRWCVVSVQVKIPYKTTGDEVYMAVYNNRYHQDPDCGTAFKKRVPLCVAHEFGKIPCPKCVPKDNS